MYNHKMAVVKRLKKESMYGLSAKKWPLHKGGCCEEVRGTQRGYSSKPIKNSIVEGILVFKR